MNEKFYDLKKEKQDKMINGAMKVFAINGFKRASTDDMVKTSGVSKGLWFHYFDNKRGLYDFVTRYGFKYAMMEYESMHTDGMTVFDLLKCFERTKVILMEKYPYLPLMIITVMEEKDPEAIELIDDIRDAYRECLNGLMVRADFGHLADNDDIPKVSFLVDSTLRRILKECYSEPTFRREYYLEECYSYIELIQKLLN